MCSASFDNDVGRQSKSVSPQMHESDTRMLMPPPPPFLFVNNLQNIPEIVTTHADATEFSNEVFQSANEVDFDKPLNAFSHDELTRRVHTPRAFKKNIEIPDSPITMQPSKITVETRIKELETKNRYLQDELQELQDFKFVENMCGNTNEDFDDLNSKLKAAEKLVLTREEDIKLLHDDLLKKKIEIEDLKSLESKMRMAETEAKKAVKDRKEAESMLAGIEYEYEQSKVKAKKREEELIACLNEARDDTMMHEKIKTLEEVLKKTEMDLFNMQAEQSSVSVETTKLVEMDKKFKELESQLQIETMNRQQAEKKIKENSKEFEQTSEQLMDAVQDNENLQNSLKTLTESISAKDKEYQELHQKLIEKEEAALRFSRIQEMLTNADQESQDVNDDDEIGKIIVKLLHTASKTETLEVEKLQLLKEIDEIRSTAVELSERLSANQTITEADNQLREKIEYLTEELQKLKNELDTEKSAVLDRETKLDEWESKYVAITSEKQTLIDEIGKLKLEIDLTKNDSEIMHSHDEIRENFMKIQNYESEIEKFTKQIEEIQNQRDELRDENCQLERSMKELDIEYIKRGEYLKEAENTKSELDLKISDSEALLVEWKTKFDEVLKEKELLIQTVEQLNEQTEIAACNIQSDEQQQNLTKIKEYKNQIKEFSQQIDVMKQQHKELMEINDDKEKTIHELSDELVQLEKRVTENETAQTNVEVEKLATELRLRELQTIHDEMTAENRALLLNVEELAEHLKSNSSFEDLHSDLTEKSNKIHEYQGEIQTLTKKVEDLERQRDVQEKTVVDLKQKLIDLEDDFGKRGEELLEQLSKGAEYANKIDELQEQLNEAANEKDALYGNVDELRNNLKSIVGRDGSLEADIQEKASKIEKYEKELNNLTQDIEKIRSDRDNQIKYIGQLEMKNFTLSNECKNYDTQLCEKSEQYCLLENELKHVNEQLKQKTSEIDDMRIRTRRRSQDNDRKVQDLEMAKSKLTESVGSIQAEKASIENELKKLKELNSKALTEKRSHDEKCTKMNEKNTRLEAELAEHKAVSEAYMNNYKAENERLKKEVELLGESFAQNSTENYKKDITIKELREKCDNLAQEIEYMKYQPKKSSSPVVANRRSGEEFENDAFALQHKQLHIETNHGTPVRTMRSHLDRKNRRQSVHDERRRLSTWELTDTAETQTDPVTDMCACNDLLGKIKQLQIELRKREITIANSERMEKCNPLKLDLAEMKKVLLISNLFNLLKNLIFLLY